MVCAVWRVARSTVYASRGRVMRRAGPLSKRGPRTAVSDAELVAAIRSVLEESRFHTEGHRKVRARLRSRGMYVGKNRVLRLMRAHRADRTVGRLFAEDSVAPSLPDLDEPQPLHDANRLPAG